MKHKLFSFLFLAAAFLLSVPATANQLAVKKDAKAQGTILIPVERIIKLNGVTNEQLYQLRTNAVEKNKNLLADTYEPSDTIFGMCESKKPWWGVWGMHIYREGQHAPDGPSKESMYILNPFRLVSAEANNVGLWNKAAVTPADMSNPEFPFLWESGPVLFNAKLATAQVWYNITKYNESLKKWQKSMKVHVDHIPGFSLIAYNARDFGYHYIYLDPQKSFGLKRWPAQAVQITQFLHCG
ncbi:MAG: hypothetical protein K2X29_07180, partial [Candidatus Obscuribacterales bacterium]|nr:hypothetical protein [Candidatus Obscuribacterales bacterium]